MDWDAVDPLYAGRPEDFVAGRDALVKQLRAAGDREAASEVARLRRPTATAHALNQVARQRPELLEDALEARAALRLATEGAGRGEATELREATAADRDATRALVAAAREVLGRDDPGLGQRITGTLLAAVLDPAVAATLRAGRLQAELDASALALTTADDDGAVAEVVSLAERAAAKRASKRTAAAREDEAAAREAAAAAEAAERARRRERAEREQQVARLERRIVRLEGKVEEAEAALAEVRDELAAATRELEEAQAALDGLV